MIFDRSMLFLVEIVNFIYSFMKRKKILYIKKKEYYEKLLQHDLVRLLFVKLAVDE